MTAIGATPPTAARAEATDVVIGNFTVNAPFTTDISVAGLRTADGNYDTNSISNSNRFLTATVVRGKFANNGDFDINTDAFFVKQSNKWVSLGSTAPVSILTLAATQTGGDDTVISTLTFKNLHGNTGANPGEATITALRGGDRDESKLTLSTSNSGGVLTEHMKIDEAGGIFELNLKSGATQGAATAAINETWYTVGHATLPDGVKMQGL